MCKEPHLRLSPELQKFLVSGLLTGHVPTVDYQLRSLPGTSMPAQTACMLHRSQDATAWRRVDDTILTHAKQLQPPVRATCSFYRHRGAASHTFMLHTSFYRILLHTFLPFLPRPSQCLSRLLSPKLRRTSWHAPPSTA